MGFGRGFGSDFGFGETFGFGFRLRPKPKKWFPSITRFFGFCNGNPLNFSFSKKDFTVSKGFEGYVLKKKLITFVLSLSWKCPFISKCFQIAFKSLDDRFLTNKCKGWFIFKVLTRICSSLFVPLVESTTMPCCSRHWEISSLVREEMTILS